MSNEFAGKTALVTGASRGIGAATAVALAQAGCGHVLIHYGSYEAGIREVEKQVIAAGAACDVVQADLGTDAGIQSLLDWVSPRAGSLDYLINNAGSLVKRALLPEITPDLYETVMNLNVKSVLLLSQLVGLAMAERGSGVIVNVSSIAARSGGGPGAIVYTSAKAAVAGMTKGLAKELAGSGVRVNAISPGTVDNHFHEQFSTRERLEGIAKQTPTGKLSSNEEMADVILFLCSEASRDVIGQTIEINGGAYMI